MGSLLNMSSGALLQKKPYDAEVEYIKSSGTQYINADITYNSANTYVIECGVTIHDSGTVTGNGWDAGGLFGQLTGKPTNGDGNAFGVAIQNTYVVMTLTINAGANTQTSLSVNVNGTIYSRNRAHGSLGTYASTYGYLLFAVRSKTSVSYKIKESIYYCKIKQNGTLVRDFIPVRIDTTGYLYDKVSGTLFGNSGSGSFTLGNDI